MVKSMVSFRGCIHKKKRTEFRAFTPKPMKNEGFLFRRLWNYGAHNFQNISRLWVSYGTNQIQISTVAGNPTGGAIISSDPGEGWYL